MSSDMSGDNKSGSLDWGDYRDIDFAVIEVVEPGTKPGLDTRPLDWERALIWSPLARPVPVPENSENSNKDLKLGAKQVQTEVEEIEDKRKDLKLGAKQVQTEVEEIKDNEKDEKKGEFERQAADINKPGSKASLVDLEAVLAFDCGHFRLNAEGRLAPRFRLRHQAPESDKDGSHDRVAELQLIGPPASPSAATGPANILGHFLGFHIDAFLANSNFLRIKWAKFHDALEHRADSAGARGSGSMPQSLRRRWAAARALVALTEASEAMRTLSVDNIKEFFPHKQARMHYDAPNARREALREAWRADVGALRDALCRLPVTPKRTGTATPTPATAEPATVQPGMHDASLRKHLHRVYVDAALALGVGLFGLGRPGEAGHIAELGAAILALVTGVDLLGLLGEPSRWRAAGYMILDAAARVVRLRLLWMFATACLLLALVALGASFVNELRQVDGGTAPLPVPPWLWPGESAAIASILLLLGYFANPLTLEERIALERHGVIRDFDRESLDALQRNYHMLLNGSLVVRSPRADAAPLSARDIQQLRAILDAEEGSGRELRKLAELTRNHLSMAGSKIEEFRSAHERKQQRLIAAAGALVAANVTYEFAERFAEFSDAQQHTDLRSYLYCLQHPRKDGTCQILTETNVASHAMTDYVRDPLKMQIIDIALSVGVALVVGLFLAFKRRRGFGGEEENPLVKFEA